MGSLKRTHSLKPYYFQDGWLTWFLAGDLSSSPWGPLHRTAWASSWRGCYLPLEWVIRGRAWYKLQCILWPSFKSHTLSFQQYPTGYTGHPYWCERDHRAQDTNTLEAILEAGCHTFLLQIQWISVNPSLTSQILHSPGSGPFPKIFLLLLPWLLLFSMISIIVLAKLGLSHKCIHIHPYVRMTL